MNYRLTIITQNQNKLEKANKMAQKISEILLTKHDIKVEKYNKFPNSFRIVITGQLNKDSSLIDQSIELTDHICSPWIVTYDRERKTIELIFNSNDQSRYSLQEFNVISWGHFEIYNENILST